MDAVLNPIWAGTRQQGKSVSLQKSTDKVRLIKGTPVPVFTKRLTSVSHRLMEDASNSEKGHLYSYAIGIC